MLNLLIREDRHDLRREYLMRFLLVFLFFIFVTLFIWGVVLFSFSLIIGVESNVAKDQLDIVLNSSDSQSLSELVSLNEQVKNRVSQFNILNFEQSDLLKEVLSKNQDGISLNLISTNLDYKDEGVFANIEIKGVARNRNILILYQESLVGSELFETADIPFSSFAQNSNISFSVNIKTVELNNYFKDEN